MSTGYDRFNVDPNESLTQFSVLLSQLSAQANDWQAAETARVVAELQRAQNEAARVAAEALRASDPEELSTMIALKANISDVETWLLEKANVTDMSAALDLKGNITDINSWLALKADLDSPTFTGIPSVPTATADTSTAQAASTLFVTNQASASNPLMNGAVAVGTSKRYARADHVHPIDTSRAPLASPTFTGTPAAPTAAKNTNTTQLATMAALQTQLREIDQGSQITVSSTLALAHKGQTVLVNSASAVIVTVPLNSAVAFPVNSQIELVRYGAGTVTIAATGGVTIRSSESKATINKQYESVILTKIGTDEWLLQGALA